MGDHGHVWTITPHLRWAWVSDPSLGFVLPHLPHHVRGGEILELQQAWENINGDVEWRPVPIVEK